MLSTSFATSSQARLRLLQASGSPSEVPATEPEGVTLDVGGDLVTVEVLDNSREIDTRRGEKRGRGEQPTSLTEVPGPEALQGYTILTLKQLAREKGLVPSVGKQKLIEQLLPYVPSAPA